MSEEKNYRAKVHELIDGREQMPPIWKWRYRHAYSSRQAWRYLINEYPFPRYKVEEPILDVNTGIKIKKEESPTPIEELKEGVQLEGGIFGGAYNINRLRFAEKDASIRITIADAQKKYNKIRNAQGLESVTDWSKRPEVTLEQKYRDSNT